MGEGTYTTGSNLNVYNEGGQRMSKTEEGEEERYFYTGSAILYTRNGYGDLTTENILSLSGQIIASKRFDDDGDPGTTYELANLYFFYHYDIRGSVTAIVRPDGTLIEGYTYDEFGNLNWTEYDSNGDPVEAVEEIFDNEVTYTGSVTDTSTGLQYMNARYYDSSVGRFLTQDSYTGNPYDPWTQHLYSYCGNNPVNMIDPTGHTGQSVVYITNSDYTKQKNELNRIIGNCYKAIDICNSLLLTTEGSIRNSIYKVRNMATTTLTEYNSKLDDLEIRNTYSRGYDKQKNKIYQHEEDAAAAFLAAEVPNTANDTLERSAYITSEIGYMLDPNTNELTLGRGYVISSPTFVGCWRGNVGYIGDESLMYAISLGQSYSMVHTHPATYPNGQICQDGFSGLAPGLDNIGDYDMLFIGPLNVYMGNPNSNNVYKLDINGEQRDVNGNLIPVCQY